MLGNSDVTKSQNVAVNPAAVFPANADKGTECLPPRKLVTLFSILALGVIAAPVYALKVTEPAAAAHGYPGLSTINGKKLADGEFRPMGREQIGCILLSLTNFPRARSMRNTHNFDKQPELIQEKVLERIETGRSAA